MSLKRSILPALLAAALLAPVAQAAGNAGAGRLNQRLPALPGSRSLRRLPPTTPTRPPPTRA